MAAKPLPSQETLRQLLDYKPETGELFWKERRPERFANAKACAAWNGRFAGRRAFSTLKQGYLVGRIEGVDYQAHRVIWKLETGEDPFTTDHIDGVKTNNLMGNLRSVQGPENQRNASIRSDNSSGYGGVNWNHRWQRWDASYREGGRRVFVGSFKDKQAAIAAHKEAKIRAGFTGRHGT